MRKKKSPETRRLYEFIQKNAVCHGDIEKMIKASYELPESSDPNKRTDRNLQAAWDLKNYFLSLESSYYMKFWFRDKKLTEKDVLEALPQGKVSDWDILWYQLAEYLLKRYHCNNRIG